MMPATPDGVNSVTSIGPPAHTGAHAPDAGPSRRPPTFADQAALFAAWLKLFVSPGDITELRALKVVQQFRRKPHTEGGFYDFDHLDDMVGSALEITRDASGVYFTLNPLHADLLSRRCNRFGELGEGEAAGDADVTRRRWLLIDADPQRRSGISASDGEKELARDTATTVRENLREMGWPEPIYADSGNGYHLLYRIDLPADDGGLVRRVLTALADRFDTGAVKVDRSVHNPSRICKLYGTFARKGDSTPDRPHRRAKVLEVPRVESVNSIKSLATARIDVVPVELLEALVTPEAATVAADGKSDDSGVPARPATAAPRTALSRTPSDGGAGAFESRLDVGRWLAARGIAHTVKARPASGGRTVYLLDACPFNAAHGRDNEVCVMQAPSGQLAAQCMHSSCSGRGWHDFKAAIGKPDADHYDPPLRPKKPRTAIPACADGDLPLLPPDGDGEAGDGGTAGGGADDAPGLRNYTVAGVSKKGTPIRVGRNVHQVAADLLTLTAGWPKRVQDQLFVTGADGRPLWLRDAANLFAWVARQFPAGADNPVRWAAGHDMVTREVFEAHLEQTVEDFDAVEPLPHQPPLPRHYYLHPATAGGDGKALEGLLDFFRPATVHDRELMKAAFLTAFWGGPPGQRPAFLVTSDADEKGDEHKGRGSGKTTFARKVADLCGGYIDVRPTDDIEAVKRRLLSPGGMGQRIVLLDNIKTHRLSWSDLENMITANVVSGHRMYEGEGRRPNTLVWFLTVNGPSFSTDVAQRVVTIMVTKPPYDPHWEATTAAYIDTHRWAIIGDLLAALSMPPAELRQYTRWGLWDREVLARVAEPDACQDLLVARRAAVDDDQSEADLVRDYIADQLRRRGHDPARHNVFIPTATAAAWTNDATGERRPTNKASAHLGSLPISELRRSNRGGARGWLWRCADGDPHAPAVALKSLALDIRLGRDADDTADAFIRQALNPDEADGIQAVYDSLGEDGPAPAAAA